MPNRLRLACVTALLLPICACRSWSSATPPVPQCLPPPAPAAWIMAPYAPDLTRRMLDELSPSPTTATAD
ncbi:lysis system o-spanin lipoprotein Rz1 [Pseudomonas sp. RtIB026]|uniref:lysis system o-spanin lipoprotein Rz1 n=1 Tax=Pseudomonas sp. RtIB026 TaxID=2749999 RepID=UPI003B632CC9